MLVSIHELSIVDLMIIEVEKSFIGVVGSDGMAEVDTIFVFFY